MINEALLAIPIRVHRNKTVAVFQTIFKRVWNCLLCLLSFLSVKHWSEGTYDLPYKIHDFPSRRSVKNCTCLCLLHVRPKTRGVEGLLPKLRAFLTNLMYITLIIFLQSRLDIEYTRYLVFISHRNNVSLQPNIFFELYFDICAMYIGGI